MYTKEKSSVIVEKNRKEMEEEKYSAIGNDKILNQNSHSYIGTIPGIP